MGRTHIAALGDGDEAAVLDYVVAAQADAARHVTFVGEGPATVRSDLTAVDAWRERTLVATDEDGDVTGVLVVDTDVELGRCWWLGPWADDLEVAHALLAAAEPLVADLPHREFAPDASNRAQAELATALGYRSREASAILGLDLTAWDDDLDVRHASQVQPLDAEDRDAVAALHDRLFPGTHTPGRRLVRDPDTAVLTVGEPPQGYVATQTQPDASIYVDFLGVEPGARGRGLARALLTAALRAALDEGIERAFLTVHVSNDRARGLYAALGFTEERVAQPFILDRRR